MSLEFHRMVDLLIEKGDRWQNTRVGDKQK